MIEDLLVHAPSYKVDQVFIDTQSDWCLDEYIIQFLAFTQCRSTYGTFGMRHKPFTYTCSAKCMLTRSNRICTILKTNCTISNRI